MQSALSRITSAPFRRRQYPAAFAINLALPRRYTHSDGRTRLSRFWTPTGGITAPVGEQEYAQSLLVRGGFVRQAHSGLFQLLPLGLRVQEKIERLLDKHMTELGASKLSLSNVSSTKLWKRSGRLSGDTSELFQLKDRRGANLLLSPTHEEDITHLVGGIINSHKELPLLLYQISRKYRDEPRPRQGLLRSREFLMKDLYTFDSTPEDALQTYEKVRRTYDAFFGKFNIPFITAEADSGGIGGDLSHEYHFVTPNGEDTIISCGSCGYVTNEELARSLAGANVWEVRRKNNKPDPAVHEAYRSWLGVSSNRSLVVEAVFPKDVEIRINYGMGFRGAEANPYILKSMFPALDLRIERPMKAFTDHWTSTSLNTVTSTTAQPTLPQLVQVFDYRIPQSFINDRLSSQKKWSPLYTFFKNAGLTITSSHASPDLVRIGNHDPCPKCAKPSLRVQRAIELGHTFYLGTRYSTPLHATITPKPAPKPSNDDDDDDDGSTNADRHPALETITKNKNVPQPGSSSSSSVPLQMGCHGIGISRMIAALADALSDSKGLVWPRIVAPFEVVVIANKEYEREAARVYDSLRGRGERKADGDSDAAIDVILDDRDKSFAWKLKDADLIGYPVVVLLGSTFKEQGKCEVAVRRLGRRESFRLEDVRRNVGRLLAEL